MLGVRDLRVEFDTPDGVVRAVDGVSFDVAPGAALGIVGESGAGKSVLGATLLGLTRAQGARVSGQALWDGRDLAAATERELRSVRGREIAMVFQDPYASLHPLHRVGAQVAEAVRAHRDVTRGAARARALELLEMVELPDPARALEAWPHELSGGMRQRAMIAIALANDPRLLIADEPTTALDVTVQAQILALLRRLRAELGTALVLITHDLGVIAQIVDDVAVMRAGQIVERAPAEAIFSDPKHPYTAGLLRSLPRLDAPPAQPATRRDGEPVLTARDLVKDFGATRAVDGVTLELRAGEALGLVGESGSGKSTLARMITRLLEPTSGSVEIGGRDVARLSRRELRPLRRGLQMVFQDPYGSLNPRKTVGSILAEPFAVHGLRSGKGERRRAAQELMERVGLEPQHYNRYPHEFSGGQRQRIAIARAIALEPALIVADEPVSALDVTIQAQILELLQELQRDLGLALLFIAHDLAVVRRLCDRVAVMQGGRIVEEGRADDLYANPRHACTRALLAAVPRVPAAPAGA